MVRGLSVILVLMMWDPAFRLRSREAIASYGETRRPPSLANSPSFGESRRSLGGGGSAGDAKAAAGFSTSQIGLKADPTRNDLQVRLKADLTRDGRLQDKEPDSAVRRAS